MGPNLPKTETGAIDLSGLGQGVTRGGSNNNLGKASNRRDRPTGPPGPGPRVPRASPRSGFVASSATGAIVSATVASSDPSLLSVGACYGLTDARRVEWRIVHGRPAPTRRARFRTSGAAWSPAGEYQLRTLLFAICRRHEIRCQWGVVGPFPHRNGILAAFPFGIDVRHDDRAMEGFPIFP